MENAYGVGVMNRYALFLDDETDPLDALKAQEQAKELKKKTKEAEKENKGKPEVKKAVVGVTPRKGIKETQNVKSQENKSGEQKAKAVGRPNDRPGGERPSERPPQRRRDDRPQNGPAENKDGFAKPIRRDGENRRPNFGERRNFGENSVEGGERRGPPREPRPPREGQRGGGRGGYDGRGKREFDRRSGSDRTGVKAVDKREGGGAHNWGTHKDDMEDLNKTNSEGEQTEGEKTEASPSAAAGDAKEAEPEPAPPVEEEPKELTLDEWKALRSANRVKPQFNIRKAGEGEDLTQWKNMVELEKKKENEDEESDEEYDLADYPQRVGRQKRLLSIEFTFNDSVRRGGPAGARGRGRGRGPPRPRARDEPYAPADRERERERESSLRDRDRERDDRKSARQSAPKVDDSKDFPSLG